MGRNRKEGGRGLHNLSLLETLTVFQRDYTRASNYTCMYKVYMYMQVYMHVYMCTSISLLPSVFCRVWGGNEAKYTSTFNMYIPRTRLKYMCTLYIHVCPCKHVHDQLEGQTCDSRELGH